MIRLLLAVFLASPLIFSEKRSAILALSQKSTSILQIRWIAVIWIRVSSLHRGRFQVSRMKEIKHFLCCLMEGLLVRRLLYPAKE